MPSGKAPSYQTTSPSRLEALLVILALALALWILGTTLNIIRTGWVAIPTVDDWDRWISYLNDHYSLRWFFEQHYDHRLAAPKLLFAIDQTFFHARGWFLLLCSFCFQVLTGFLLWRLAGLAYPQSRMERSMQAAILVSCLFSAQQWTNFVMPFQVQFILVYCAVAAALFALWQSAVRAWNPSWMAASLLLAGVATYSMANGILIWPVLLLAGVWLRMPRRWTAGLAAGALLIVISYFYNWHPSSAPVHLALTERLPRAVLFSLTHMGSPVAPLATPLTTTFTTLRDFAVIPGALLALVLALAFVMLWRRREHYNSARAMLVLYCVFIAGTSATIAYGRSEGPLSEAFEWRYLTPSYILWAGLLLAVWPMLRRVPRAALYAVLCTAILAGIAAHQETAMSTVRWWAGVIHLGETAVVDNVADPDPWQHLYYSQDPPRMLAILNTVDFLKYNHLTLFTEEWTHWPGIPLKRRFSIDLTPDACQGRFEPAVPVSSTLRPGWRTNGWAWDHKAGRSPRYVILADDSGLVAGVALTGFPPPPALAYLPQRYVASNWSGYVNGHPRTITAYVLEADQRSLCAIGKQELHGSGTQVAFAQLGARLPDAPSELSAAWVPDGYYKGTYGPGAPPVDGRVFGSFPDAHTGSIRLGPFHLDGHTGIAIPVVSGPDSHNLSILVRDAATREVLAQITPPPRTTWWAWNPELPSGRELTVEIVADDHGAGWGEWLALGWPHALLPR